MNRNIQTLFLISITVLFVFVLAPSTHAATLYFSPSFGSYEVGKTFSVSIYVSSADQAMNAASGAVSFPVDKLEVASLSKADSVFGLWFQEPSFSNSAGTVNFEGIVLNPGFTGSSGKAITIIFRVKAVGNASLTFSSGLVLANDGKGMNILASLASAGFVFKMPEAAAPSEIVGIPSAPAISSSTHSDPNKWYNSGEAKFSWKLPFDVTAARLLYDQHPASVPTVVYSPPISEKEIGDIPDGVWYFHARFRNAAGWGAVSHFRIQVDTKAPDVLSVVFQESEETDNPRPTISANYKDSLSGTTGYCEVKVDNGEWFASNYESRTEEPDKPCAFKLPLQNPGKHTVLVKALDKAGNYSLVSEEFVIKALTPPKITEYPRRLTVGEVFASRGETVYPNSRVIIWIQRMGEEPKSYVVGSDEEGKFIFVPWERLQEGVYRFWAQVVDGREAKSEPSDKLTSIVEPSAFIRIGSWAIDFLAVAVSLAALLFTFVFIIWRGWHKLALLRRRLRKEVREAEFALHKAFNLLKEDIHEQITLLERTRIRRELTKEEGKIIKQLNKDLEDAEKFVKKEIEDIKKEIK